MRKGGSTVVQRAAFGLMKKDEVSGFAGLALDLWRANRDMSLEDFNKRLMDELNSTLAANGVPQLPAPTFGATPHAAGGFAAKTWTIILDPAKTAGHPITTKIGDLNADQVAEVAGICYHEARHAEQAFLVACLVASQAKGNKDPNAIATALEIPVPVADAAIKAQAHLPGKSDLATIEQWRAFSPSGKRRDYQDWNEKFRGFVQNVVDQFPSPRPEGVDRVTDAWQDLTRTIGEWRKDTLPFVDDKISRLKKAKTAGPSDQQVLRDLQKIRAGSHEVINADKALGDKIAKFQARQAQQAEGKKEPLTVSEARVIQTTFALGWLDLEIAVRGLGQTTEKAYMNYPDEADAYAAERAVMQMFQSKAKSASAKP